MAGKKKGKKKGKKGSGSATPTPQADSPAVRGQHQPRVRGGAPGWADTAATQPGEDFEPLDVTGEEPRFVTLHCELLNWRFSAFTLRLPLSTPLFSLRQKVADKHGPVTDLKLYVDQAVDKNELKGEFEVRSALQRTALPRGPRETERYARLIGDALLPVAGGWRGSDLSPSTWVAV